MHDYLPEYGLKSKILLFTIKIPEYGVMEGGFVGACTFFGHRRFPDSIRPVLTNVLNELIVNCGIDIFYVGRQGAFDSMVRSVLAELSLEFSHIKYSVVLERMPVKHNELDLYDYSDTILPDGIENVHPRYAIVWRNRWMLGRSQVVVAYVSHQWGGAAKFMELAEKQGRKVYNLAV